MFFPTTEQKIAADGGCEPASSLHVIVTEAGVEAWGASCCTQTMCVDLADIRAWRFFKSSEFEFFEQYRNDFLIDHVHLADDVPAKCVEYLKSDRSARLEISGHFSDKELFALQKECRAAGVSVTVDYVRLPRAFSTVIRDKSEGGVLGVRSFCTLKSLERAIIGAGVVAPADGVDNCYTYWTKWFNRFLALEVIPVLRVRDVAVFYTFMKVLAHNTAKPINWTHLARMVDVTPPTVKEWARFLMHCGLIRLVAAQPARPPRRAITRPKLFWTAPGLALWLGDRITMNEHGMRAALVENAVYLSLFDTFPGASFSHFRDTNYIECQLMVEENGVRHAVFYCLDTLQRARAAKHHASLARAGLCTDHALLIDLSPASLGNETPYRLRAEVMTL